MTTRILMLLTVMLVHVPSAAVGQDGAPAYKPVLQYDPKRDAAKDVDEAVAEARSPGRHVLLEVGGEWCIWCHRLDDFLAKPEELGALLERNFVLVKVNFSPENKNEKVLSLYPEIGGFPHFFVLGREGSCCIRRTPESWKRASSTIARDSRRS